MKSYILGIIKADNETDAFQQFKETGRIKNARNGIIPFLDEQGADYTISVVAFGGKTESFAICASIEDLYMTMFQLKFASKLMEMTPQRLARIQANK